MGTACGGAAGAAGARDGCILFRCASCLSNRARARYHMYCRGTVFLSSRRCCGAMQSGAERGRRGDGDESVTRNKGAFSLPFFLLKVETSCETSSEGFLRVLHCVCRVFLQERYTYYRYTHAIGALWPALCPWARRMGRAVGGVVQPSYYFSGG